MLAVVAGMAGLLLASLMLRALSPSCPPRCRPGAVGRRGRVAASPERCRSPPGRVRRLSGLDGTRYDSASALRDGGRGTVGVRKGGRTRNVLVIVEVALAVMLLIGAVLLIRLRRLIRVDPASGPITWLTMEIALPKTSYRRRGRQRFSRRS